MTDYEYIPHSTLSTLGKLVIWVLVLIKMDIYDLKSTLNLLRLWCWNFEELNSDVILLDALCGNYENVRTLTIFSTQTFCEIVLFISESEYKLFSRIFSGESNFRVWIEIPIHFHLLLLEIK